MLTNWWDAHQQGQHHPMVDRRHHTRHQLNRLARQLLHANNELGTTDITASGDRSFAMVIASSPGWSHATCTSPAGHPPTSATAPSGPITAVTPGSDPQSDRLSVAFDGIGTIEIPRSFFDEHTGPAGRADVGIDHAYAVTSYSVQGATFDISTSRIDESASRAETYVDITRGRHANHLFITRAADPLDGEHLPKAPDPALHDSIAERLRRSGPEHAAIEFPIANTPTAPARFAAHDPPKAWVSRFPNRSDDPVSVRVQQRRALEAVLSYRHRWHPKPDLGSRWAWAIGQAPTDANAIAERSEIVEELDRLAEAIAGEELRRGYRNANNRRAAGPSAAIRRTPHRDSRTPIRRVACPIARSTPSTRQIEPHRRGHRKGTAMNNHDIATSQSSATLDTLRRKEPGPLLLTVSQAAVMLAIGRTTAYELIATGDLEVVHIGRCARVPVEAVEVLVARLRRHVS